MKKLSILIAFLFFFSSCSKIDPSGVENFDLFGQWNWVSTNGGFAFHIHSDPESAGNVIQLFLKEDYGFSLMVNEEIVSTGEYEISMEKSIYSGDLERYITFSGNKNFNGIVLNGIIRTHNSNELSISDNYYDGIGSLYQKK